MPWHTQEKNKKLTNLNKICICEIEENNSNDTPACDDDDHKAHFYQAQQSPRCPRCSPSCQLQPSFTLILHRPDLSFNDIVQLGLDLS